jgi:hypothetical protein
MVLCLALVSGWAWAQVSPRAKSTEAGRKAFQRGDYAEAEKHFLAALAEEDKGTDQLGGARNVLDTSLNDLAWVYDAQKKYAAAEALRKRARAILAELRSALLAAHKVYVDPKVEMLPEGRGEEFRSALQKAVSDAGFDNVESEKEADATLATLGRIETRIYWNGVRVLDATFWLTNSKHQLLWWFNTEPDLKFQGGCASEASGLGSCAGVVARALRNDTRIAMRKIVEDEKLEPARAAGFAIVYVLREPDKSAGDLGVLLDGKEVSRLPANRYVSLGLRAGKRRLAIKECKGSDLDLALEPGQEAYLLGPKRPGAGRLQLMESRKAALLAAQLKQIEPLDPFLELTSH